MFCAAYIDWTAEAREAFIFGIWVEQSHSSSEGIVYVHWLTITRDLECKQRLVVIFSVRLIFPLFLTFLSEDWMIHFVLYVGQLSEVSIMTWTSGLAASYWITFHSLVDVPCPLQFFGRDCFVELASCSKSLLNVTSYANCAALFHFQDKFNDSHTNTAQFGKTYADELCCRWQYLIGMGYRMQWDKSRLSNLSRPPFITPAADYPRRDTTAVTGARPLLVKNRRMNVLIWLQKSLMTVPKPAINYAYCPFLWPSTIYGWSFFQQQSSAC